MLGGVVAMSFGNCIRSVNVGVTCVWKSVSTLDVVDMIDGIKIRFRTSLQLLVR